MAFLEAFLLKRSACMMHFPPLGSILHVTGRVIFLKSHHVTPLLRDLLWLPATSRLKSVFLFQHDL